jgi:hypothetical protein
MEELLARGKIKEAVALAQSLHKASGLDAASAEWLLKAARGWHAEGFGSEQHAACEIALAFFPEHFEALHLLGHAAQADGDFARAESCYARALAAKPDYAFARLALAQLRMLGSGFAAGRDQYEARFDAVTEGSGPDWRGLPAKRWRGESLEARKIYIWAEQGLGDIVMFAGFLPYLLAQSPSRAVLGMFPKLITLFQRSFPALHVEPADDAIHHALAPTVLHAFPRIERLAQQAAVPFSLAPLKAAHDYVQRHGLFDVAAPMGDLMVYGMPGYIPAHHASGYLRADPGLTAATRTRLSELRRGRRIGISWHTTNRREWMRNIPLEEWLPLLTIPGCHFISLQHQVNEDEIARFCAGTGCHITVDREVDPLKDAEGLAALIAGMDEVITIDNSNIHLAGALGVPATLLLPKGCNYRWPEREDGGTLWYKDVVVLRQREPRGWQPVMAEAGARLKTASAISGRA